MRRASLHLSDTSLRSSGDVERGEAELFGRYVLGHRGLVDRDVLARYAEGCAVLFGVPGSPEDAAVVEFVRRHPWSLAFVDAAAAALCPHTLLRKKLLLMAAVLETIPAYAESFSPMTRSRVALVLRLAWCAACSVTHALIGIPVLWLARRRH